VIKSSLRPADVVKFGNIHSHHAFCRQKIRWEILDRSDQGVDFGTVFLNLACVLLVWLELVCVVEEGGMRAVLAALPIGVT
jgi:hypothetical protein